MPHDGTVLNIAVATLGETARSAPVLGRGAGPGDTICVTGSLGGAVARRRGCVAKLRDPCFEHRRHCGELLGAPGAVSSSVSASCQS